MYEYNITLTEGVQGPLYIMAETYDATLVPRSCETVAPTAKLDVFVNLPDGSFYKVSYEKTTAKIEWWPEGAILTAQVTFEWNDALSRDFTVSVYSSDSDVVITDKCGNSHMLHTDGQEPSEWVNSQFTGMDATCGSAIIEHRGSDYRCTPEGVTESVEVITLPEEPVIE